MTAPTIMWFRRDLRLADNPALLAALEAGPVVPLFVVDPHLVEPAGPNRLAWVWASLKALDDRLGGRLVVLHGDPVQVLPQAVATAGATAVHVAADAGRYGRARDAAVQEALGVPLVRTGSAWGVTPGTLTKADGTGYRVFTPYSKVWFQRGLHSPAPAPTAPAWTDGGLASRGVPALPEHHVELLEPGEDAAVARLDEFAGHGLAAYAEHRNLPGRPGTSRMSAYLKVGAIHPRTVVDHLSGHRGEGAQTFRTEICWRDFYADVLWQAPSTVVDSLNLTGLRYDSSTERFEAWQKGETGFPLVDAGMRQLLAEGWMHNRLRMVVASFLAKDLHLPWWWGAQHFMHHLMDGDPASNSGGWQWAAGTGTDAAPYFRVFNPTAQSAKFDPDGSYIRRWVPELAGVTGKAVHEPVDVPGYAAPMVDHKAEREEALARYAEARA